jgi:hypothetical protein
VEALGALFPNGAKLIPEISTPITPASRARRTSGVQELRKQSLTEPKRLRSSRAEPSRVSRLSQLEAESPPATSAIDSGDRDTERPPARRTDRAGSPAFNEPDVPTTPAPAEALRSEGTAAESDYPIEIPRSPKAPTFGSASPAVGASLAAPSFEQNFVPTRPAGPSNEADPNFEELAARPTFRPGAADEPAADSLLRTTAPPPEPGLDPGAPIAKPDERGPASHWRGSAPDVADEPTVADLDLADLRSAEVDDPSQSSAHVAASELAGATANTIPPPVHGESDIRWVDAEARRLPLGLESSAEPTGEVDGNGRDGRKTASH